MTVIWNVDSTYVFPVYGQSMIIWDMANFMAGVATVG
jgi:hypothetical protein